MRPGGCRRAEIGRAGAASLTISDLDSNTVACCRDWNSSEHRPLGLAPREQERLRHLRGRRFDRARVVLRGFAYFTERRANGSERNRQLM